MRLTLLRLTLALCFACGCILAQSAQVAPAFDVASFKRLPVDAPRTGLIREVTPTSIHLHNASLGNCLWIAFGYQHWEIVGPEWRDYPTDVRYDIIGKTADPVPESQLKLMLQTLLKERLGLAFHLETRDLPVYALVVAPNGPKFHKSAAEGDASFKYDGLATTFERVTMARFAQTMDPPFTSRHVVDETGLTGNFDFKLDLESYITDPQTGKPILDYRGAIDEEYAFVRALPAQLGLRLERKTAPMQVMVIDHVEKDPTAN
jgi:uncharacterized protein (TIGR03435 family)